MGVLLLLVCSFLGTNLVAALSCPELVISPIVAVMEPGASLTVDVFVGEEPAVFTSLCLGALLTSSTSMVNGSGSAVVTAAGSFRGLNTLNISLNQTRGNMACASKATVNIYAQPNTSTSHAIPSCDQAPLDVSGLARLSAVSTPVLHVRTFAVDCPPGFELYGGSCFAIPGYCPSLLPLNGSTGIGACSGGRLGDSCQLFPTCPALHSATNATRTCTAGGTVAGSGVWTGDLPSCAAPPRLPVLLLFDESGRANTVRTRLAAQGFTVDVWPNFGVWPTLSELAPYGAVICYWGAVASPPNVVGGGDVLSAFYSSGGNVILTPYAACWSMLEGAWASNGYNLYATSHGSQAAASVTVHEPSSPLLTGVGTWSHPGSNMCFSPTGGGTSVVSYNAGARQLVLRKAGTRIVSINVELDVLPIESEGWKVVGNAVRYNGEGAPLRS